jgi:multiple sugar transport system substrate-binding protein
VRSLHAFGVAPLEVVAREYDLIVLDHPHVGEGAVRGYLAPLDEILPRAQLDALEAASVGRSHVSYRYGGHQWALAIDAAAQVAAWRQDAGFSQPRTWREVAALARRGGVIWPLCPTDAYASLLSIAANLGTPAGATGEFLPPAAGIDVLRAIDSVASHVPPACLEMNPIDALEALAGGDPAAAYAPLVFGYSNYARDGFRPALVRFGDMPAIREDAGPAGSLLGGAGLAVSAHTGHPAEAAAFAAWTAGDAAQAGTYVREGGQPANVAAWESGDVNELTHGFFADTRATLEGAWLRPRVPGFLPFQERAMELAHDYLTRRRDATRTIDALNTAYRTCLTPEERSEHAAGS